MSVFIEFRALGGVNYVRAADIIAVQYNEPQKCTVLLAGGGSMSCAEAAAQVKARIDAALQPKSETPDGDGSR